MVVMGVAALIAAVGALVEIGRRRRERWWILSVLVSEVKQRRAAPTPAAVDPGYASPDASGPAAPHASRACA
jgi:hypothetical protein